MLLSVNKNQPIDVKGTWLEVKFVWEKTPKGYMNAESMRSWIEKILILFINEERLKIGNNLQALLIFDGLKAHLVTEITDILQQNLITFVCSPLHSSHLLQVLDLSVFGPMKTHYLNNNNNNNNNKAQLFHGTERKMAKKVEKIIRAFYNATYCGNIFSGWDRDDGRARANCP